jgi:hypothetical protein
MISATPASEVSEPFPSNEGRYWDEQKRLSLESELQFQNLFLLMKVAT